MRQRRLRALACSRLEVDDVRPSFVARLARGLWRSVRRIAAERSAVRGGARMPGVLDWGRRYLPHHFTSPPSAMHLWLDRQFSQVSQERGGKLNVIGPRGAAKSTIATLAWPLQLAIAALEPYIWIISDTRSQARLHLENIKAELLTNRRLARDFPWAARRGPTWRGQCVVLANGVRIEAFGTGQSIRGRRHGAHRPTLIICDDLQNDSHIHSSVERDRSRRWFHGALVKAGSRRTNVVNLATALHRDALALELHRAPGWRSRIFRAIERWPERMDLWHRWEELYSNQDDPDRQATAHGFYQANETALHAGAELLWPEVEDLYSLMCMRAESGRAAFEREKQGSPTNPDLCEWPEAYFEREIWFSDWPAKLRVRTIAIDPSKGRDARHGDYSALVMLGVDERGTIYVEADLARRPTSQIVEDAVAWIRRFRPDAVGVEANQFQELLQAELAAALERQNILAPPPCGIDNTASKLVRIRRLGAYLASGRLRFRAHSTSTRMLVDQLKDFPLGDYDDGPDALEMAIRLAAELLAELSPADDLGTRLPVDVAR